MRLDARLIVFMLILLLIPSVALALTIETCSSNSNNWECQEGKLCVCKISGSCTNGNLLVYKTNLTNVLCAPPIVNGVAEIDWDDCRNPNDTVRVMADCDEGQSEERSIEIILASATTSTTTTLPTTTTSTSVTTSTTPPTTISPTTTEITKEECPYECCENESLYYDKYCDVGFKCVDNACKPIGGEETKKTGGGGVGIILILLVILIVAVVAFLKLRGNVPKTYEELYRKWRRR